MVGKINYVFTALSNFLHVLPKTVSVVGWVFSTGQKSHTSTIMLDVQIPQENLAETMF